MIIKKKKKTHGNRHVVAGIEPESFTGTDSCSFIAPYSNEHVFLVTQLFNQSGKNQPVFLMLIKLKWLSTKNSQIINLKIV